MGFLLIAAAPPEPPPPPPPTGFTPNFPVLGAYYINGNTWPNTANDAKLAPCAFVVFDHYYTTEGDVGRSLNNAMTSIKALTPVGVDTVPLHAVYVVQESTFADGSDWYTPVLDKINAENWWLRVTWSGGAGTRVDNWYGGGNKVPNATGWAHVNRKDGGGLSWIDWHAEYAKDINVDGGSYSGRTITPNTSIGAMMLDNSFWKSRDNGDYDQDNVTENGADADFRVSFQAGMEQYAAKMRAILPAFPVLGNMDFWACEGGNIYNSGYTPDYSLLGNLHQLWDGGIGVEYLTSDAREPYSYEWQERGNGLTGFNAMRNQMRFLHGTVLDPRRVAYSLRDVLHDGSAGDNQRLRFGAAAIMVCSNGIIDDTGVITANSAYNALYTNNGAGHGWLGQPVSTTPNWTPNAQGLYVREFTNGVVAVNPRNNGSRSFTWSVRLRSVSSGILYESGTAIPLLDRDGGLYHKSAALPVWTGPPAPIFTVGNASSYLLSALISGPALSEYAFASIGSAFTSAGVTIDAATKSLVYDGIGPVVTISNARLSATSTGGTANSSLFSVVIQLVQQGSAEADWVARSTGPGVVWAHDFRYPNELTNFLWIYNSPLDSGVQPRITADGATGNCLEYVALGATTTSVLGTSATTLTIDDATYWPTGDFYFHIAGAEGNGYPANPNNLFYCPAGGRSGSTLSGLTYVSSVAGQQPFATTRKSWPAGSIVGNHVFQQWNRPMSAFASPGNGLPANDINNAGNTLRTWSPPTVGNSLMQYYGYGYYGHPTHQAEYPSWTPNGGSGPIGSPRVAPWDGDEFYLQFAVKVDRRFWDYHIPAADDSYTWQHKLMFLQTQQTVPHQLVTYLDPNNRYRIPSTRTAPFVWYTTQAGRTLTDTLDGSGSIQPGSQWAATAQNATSYQAAGSAWEWYDDEWLTFLYRVKPGLHWNRESNPSATGVRNTVLEVKVARQNEAYVTLYSMTNQALTYGSSGGREGQYIDALPGYCAVIPTMYLNTELGNTPPKRSYYHRFTQFIFSKQTIPAPAVIAPVPSWAPAAGAVASYSGGGAVLTNNWRATHDPGALGYDVFDSKKINNDYSAPVFVRGWRTYGGVFFFGGGHSATNYNGAHMLSLSANTMNFECVQRPSDWVAALDRGNNLSEINSYGEVTGSSPLKLGGPHSYGSMVTVGTNRDKVLIPYNQAYGYVNVGQASQSLQSMDLSNPATSNAVRPWVRESNTLGALSGMNSPTHACYVPSQDRIYFMSRGGGNLKWVDWASKTYVTGTNAGWGYASSDSNGGDPQTGALIDIPERNLLLGCYRLGGNLVIQRITTTQSQPTVATATLSATIAVPVSGGATALLWCSRSSRVLLLGSTVYEIAIPSVLTNTWTVTSHVPNIPITFPALGAWGKFEYDDRTRSVVIPQAFVDSGNDTVLVYRPRNT